MNISFSLDFDPITVTYTVVGLALVRPLIMLLIDHLKPKEAHHDERGE